MCVLEPPGVLLNHLKEKIGGRVYMFEQQDEEGNFFFTFYSFLNLSGYN